MGPTVPVVYEDWVGPGKNFFAADVIRTLDHPVCSPVSLGTTHYAVQVLELYSYF